MKYRYVDDAARNVGLIAAAVASVIYVAVFVIAAEVSDNGYVYFGMCGLPIFFGMIYCFAYSLKEGLIKFIKFSQVRESYDNPIYDYTYSKYKKDYKSIVTTIVWFIPMLIFYVLFSWIFYLKRP